VGGNLCQDTRCVFYNQSAWWRAANDHCLKLDGNTCHVAPQGRRCHAAYQGDLAAALIACEASVQVAGMAGTYQRPVAELFRDDGAAHLTLGLQELVVAVHVPVGPPGRVCGFRKVRSRGAMDFPLASVGVALRIEQDVLAELTVGVSGTQSFPLRLQGTAQAARSPGGRRAAGRAGQAGAATGAADAQHRGAGAPPAPGGRGGGAAAGAGPEPGAGRIAGDGVSHGSTRRTA
jgi:4-hydroxybenzoyl-CoA reductase subunit beta